MDAIILHGVKTHNLKNFDLILPHQKLYVITGVSGSGKSSLAFDTLYAEGQRRYVESLSAYARQFLERMEKPDVESVSGIPPALAIEAKNVITNARSTVGTQTEINDYLRLFYARIGQTFCPDCQLEVLASHPLAAARLLSEKYAGQEILILFELSLGKGGRKHLKEFLPELERQGFMEFYLNGKVVSAEAVLNQGEADCETLTVCVDRLSAETKNRKRLVDSLETAYRYGKGEIQAGPAGKLLKFSESLRCHSCGKSFRAPTPNLFSFNSPLGACLVCQGFGRVITLDWDLVVPDPNKSLEQGAIEPWTKPSAEWEFRDLMKFAARKKIPIKKPWKNLSKIHQEWVLRGLKGDDYFSVEDYFKHLEKKTYKMHVRIFLSKYRTFIPCQNCQESRLKPEALYVKIADRTIFELQTMSIEDLQVFLESLKIEAGDFSRVEPVFLELKKRIRFLNEVGLGYLSLSRLSRTLSGGEVQRIHLATSLGSALVDTLYVLDEPSVGLHERDNQLLIRLLRELRNLGNTVVVVEHDRAMIEACDEILDMGPGGGEKGGEILFQGKVEAIYQSERSITGQYLSGARQITKSHSVTEKSRASVRIYGASEHNLKNVNVEIPLNRMVVVTGVSGSGKSTLLYECLYRHYLRFRGQPVQDMGQVERIEGFDQIDEMVLVDQAPIGRSSRSNPVTYIKAYDEIRKVFSNLGDARRRGYSAGFFSFNVDGGRCDHCKGDGVIQVEMNFLADVYVKCEACQGRRFKSEVLEIRYQGKNVDDVLAMTVDEAMRFFEKEKSLIEKLELLTKVGLGYLRLGQPATTLSGGEAQRLKLAVEISERSAKHILYLFDEPTTGLHYQDISYLMKAFDELLVKGHSVVVIEHNMEIIRFADFIIDLGPEGGQKGGEIVYAGDRQGVIKCTKSYTGKYLKEHLTRLSLSPKNIRV